MEESVLKTFSYNDRGFSLIEVLVSVALLSFLAVGVLTMTTMNINSNSFAQHHSKAVQLAESGLEEMRRVDYTTQLGSCDGVVNNYGSIPNYPDFRRTFNVTYGADISTLRVTVTWRVMGTDSVPLVMTTLRVAP
jgi:prepilin-type N-terminal cleavage/methylation domain-containing protein